MPGFLQGIGQPATFSYPYFLLTNQMHSCRSLCWTIVCNQILTTWTYFHIVIQLHIITSSLAISGGVLYTVINQEIGRYHFSNARFFLFKCGSVNLIMAHNNVWDAKFRLHFDFTGWICIYQRILMDQSQSWYLLLVEPGLLGEWFKSMQALACVVTCKRLYLLFTFLVCLVCNN